MTMTRQQLEDVISRQLNAAIDRNAVAASQRAILAAVDDWAASQVTAAVTPRTVVTISADSRLAPLVRWLRKGTR